MTPRELIRSTSRSFSEAGIPDPLNDAALLLAHVTGRDALSLRLDFDTQLPADTLAAYAALCEKRLNRVPLQYLTGVQSFLGRDFFVDSRVLIPRPETELLAELALRRLNGTQNPCVLDLCCGSGCLAVSIALECSSAEVHATDISTDALAVSRINAQRLLASVTFHQGDLLAPLAGMRFDLIVSNPPYIPAEACRELQEEVRREPVTALDGGEDGLDFYRRISLDAPKHLNAGGYLLLEVGWDQAEDVSGLLRSAGFHDVSIHKDLSGIDRMIEGHL